MEELGDLCGGFSGISIRAVTAVDVSSTLRLPATSPSDWQAA
jgi:hypothetical protein